MKRYDINQNSDIYNRYFKISKNIMDQSINNTTNDLRYKFWRRITDEGLWGLSISKKYNGKGFYWKDCISAIDALFRNYPDKFFFDLLINQISVLYMIAEHADNKIKKKYLPKLIDGCIARLDVSSFASKQLRSHFMLNGQFNEFFNSVKVVFIARIIKNNGNMYILMEDISSAKTSEVTANCRKKISSYAHYDILSENAALVLYDIVRFNQLLYSILSMGLIQKLNFRIFNQYFH